MKHPGAISLTAAFVLTLLFPPGAWAQEYTAGPVSDGGTISGSVIHTGVAAERSVLVIDKDAEVCGQTSKSSAELIVDPASHGIQNVVVSITDISHGKDWTLPDEGLTLDQKGCWFTPHVLVVPVGQSFHVLNDDDILHNVHTHGEENRPINKAQPKFLKRLKMSFRRAEFVQITCDVHGWMEGWVVAANHPYHAVTDENGNFRLENVPPGSYTLEFWHETLGKQSRQVQIAAGGAAQVEATFPEGG